ncbi:Tfp pilus assembly protein PilF [Alteromonadaceae bacterium Bs31]|nr:Tfp pilus assembly protein PilF [Alteromonadaceae bacterium Bs31]
MKQKPGWLWWGLLLLNPFIFSFVHAIPVTPVELESSPLQLLGADNYSAYDPLSDGDVIQHLRSGDATANDIVTDVDKLSNEELRVVLMTALQTGEIAGAVAIAGRIEKYFPQDTYIQVAYALKSAFDGDIVRAAMRIEKINATDKFERAARLLASAYLSMRSEKTHQALKELDALLDILPEHAYARVLKAEVLLKQGQVKKGALLLSEVLELHPNMRIALINAGSLALRSGNNQMAAAYFSHLREIDNSCIARLGEASANNALSKSQNTISLVSPCLNHPEQEIRLQSLQLTVESYLAAGRYLDAEKTLKNITESDRLQLALLVAKVALFNSNTEKTLALSSANEPGMLLLHVLALIEQKNYSKATQRVKILREKAPDSESTLVLIATLNILAGNSIDEEIAGLGEGSSYRALLHVYSALESGVDNIDEVLNTMAKTDGLIKGIQLSKISAESQSSLIKHADRENLVLALLFYQFEIEPLALSHFQESAKQQSDFISTYLFATLAEQAGMLEQALQSIDKTRAVLPEFSAVHQVRATILLKLSRLELALDALNEVLSLQPDPFTALKAGAIAERLGKLEQAEQLYGMAVLLAPNNFIGLNQLAWFYANHGIRLDEGIALAKKALELSPASPNLLDTLGWLHVQNGDLKSAQSVFNQALTLSDGKPGHSILFHLAYVESQLGNSTLAKNLLQRIALNPENQKYQQQAQALLAELVGVN